MMTDDNLLGRRDFLQFCAGGVGLGWLVTNFGFNHLVRPLVEQVNTWQQVNCPADRFFEHYGGALAQLHFGANLCPDYQLFAAGVDPEKAVRILKELFGCRQIRLAMRWSTHIMVGMDAYDRWIEALLRHDIQTVVAYGIKSPFPPETHFPPAIEAGLLALGVHKGSTIQANSPLGQMGLSYSQTLLEHLATTFGLASFAGFNVENEFDAHFGLHRLAIGEDLLRAQAQLLHSAVTHNIPLFLNTAIISPPGRQASLTTVVDNALALQQEFPKLQPIIGVDMYEETDSGRVSSELYLDTFTGVRLRHGDQLIPHVLQELAAARIGLEVTEFQLSDWIREPRRIGPGSRVHIQYLLARLSDNLLANGPFHATPFVARLWEMSKVLLDLLADEQSFYTNDAYSLIQRVNQQSS